MKAEIFYFILLKKNKSWQIMNYKYNMLQNILIKYVLIIINHFKCNIKQLYTFTFNGKAYCVFF